MILFAMLPPPPLEYRLVLAGGASLAFGALTAILARQKDRKRLRLFVGFALAIAIVVLIWSFELFFGSSGWGRTSIDIGVISAILAFVLPPRFSKPTKDKSTQS